MAGLRESIVRLAESESLRPDLSRAVRGTVALSVPLLLGLSGHLPVQASYAVLVAMNVATVDVRGSYPLRFALLASMTVVLVASAGIGGFAAAGTLRAVCAMGVIALLGGLWRHLSSDYGPALGISSTLVFALGLTAHPDPLAPEHHALAALAGGLWGLSVQVVLWPLRPQHPLRRTASDTWLALSDLFAALVPEEGLDAAVREQRILGAEIRFHTTREQTTAALQAAKRRPGSVVAGLTELNQLASQMATRVVAFNDALESLMRRGDFATVAPSFLPVLTALTNTSRTVALAVVSRQPSHLKIADLRLRRAKNLMSVLAERASARTDGSDESARLREIIAKVQELLPRVEASLRGTIDRAGEREAFSLELFDLDTWRLKPLASAIDLSLRVDPSLVRYGLRSAALTMIGVWAVMDLHLRHGYWLPFTMMVVLQPDYGSTRQKAAQRVLGTVAGSALASAILFLNLAAPAALAATIATGFAFNYCTKRNYAVAVVFITLFVVLLTETGGAVDLSFTFERLATTMAGGLMALLAAFLFWPTWERDRFPSIMAAALRANGDYLDALVRRILQGGAPDAPTLHAKRRSESANAQVFSSLRRLSGDPKNRQEMIERAAALANGNQRLTQAMSGILLHLEAGPGVPAGPVLDTFRARAGEALLLLAKAAETGESLRDERDTLRSSLDKVQVAGALRQTGDPASRRLVWILAQLGRASTELAAMLLS